jgi:tetratricopeptide (TPR) repeat protein
MPEKDIKVHLLQTLAESERRERELQELCDDQPSNQPTMWTAKDHLAHLAHWRRYATRVLTAVHTGATPPSADDVDGVNSEVFSANQERPAAEVKADARASYSELVEAIEACSEAELLARRTDRDLQVWEVVPPNGHLHLGEHLGFWYEAHGDDEAAERAQLWTHSVHEAAFTEPRSRAFGEYNLGCFYARRGRIEEALPHILRSFELHPGLKESARTDKDLNRIRDDAAVRAALE